MYTASVVGIRRSSLLWLAIAIAGCGGGGGNGSTPPPNVPPPPPADVTPPDTTITGKPASFSSSSATTFVASATETGSTFEASLDSSPFTAATMPLQLTGLIEGHHSISIRARDVASNIDPTPATFEWVVDTTGPTARIVFPLANSYTDGAVLTFRGSASDANGIASVRVNDIDAESADGFQTWTAVVPVGVGETQVLVSVTDSAGNASPSAASASVANRGPVIGQSAGMAMVESTNKLVIADSASQALYSYDTVKGTGSVLASYNGPGFYIGAMAIETSSHRAIIVDSRRDTLAGIDLTTGTIQDISPSNPSVDLYDATSIAIDQVNGKAFIAAGNSVVAIKLDTGARTVLSGGVPAVGTGPYLTQTPVIALDTMSDPNSPRLVGAVDLGGASAEIISIDLATGNRAVLAPSDSVSPAIVYPKSAVMDPNTHRLLVSDSRALLAVDLTTGNRTTLTGVSVGSGPMFSAAVGLAFSHDAKVLVAQRHGEVISVEPSTGVRQTIVHSAVGDGPRLGSTDRLVVEQANGSPHSLLILEGGRLARIDLATGNRTAVSSSTVGSGPFSTGFTALTLDTRIGTTTPSALAILAEMGEVVTIDLTNGNRTSIGALGLSGSTNLQRALEVDAAANRIYFTNIDLSGSLNPGLYSYDLTSAQRATVSDNLVGTGPQIGFPVNFLLDPDNARVIVSDTVNPGMISIDTHSGERKLFATEPNTDPFAGRLYLDKARSRIVGLGFKQTTHIFTIDLPDGTNRRVLSGFNSTEQNVRGHGPTLLAWSGLGVDENADVAYVTQPYTDGVMAIDLISGDRILISH